MRFSLTPHPGSPPDAAFSIWASAERSAAFGETATLSLWFGLTAPIAHFAVPALADQPRRRDGLWQATCFELFLKEAGQEAYQEWNFSPSGDWAAYDFTSERTGMREADVCFVPNIRTEDNLIWWGLGATLSIPAEASFTIGLSAVIEEAGGHKSYWALHHPGPEPDFHHPDCFPARLA